MSSLIAVQMTKLTGRTKWIVNVVLSHYHSRVSAPRVNPNPNPNPNPTTLGSRHTAWTPKSKKYELEMRLRRLNHFNRF